MGETKRGNLENKFLKMAHRQAPALPQSGKGEGFMQNPQPDCNLTVMCQVKAKIRVAVVGISVIGLATGLSLDLQIRTREELA